MEKLSEYTKNNFMGDHDQDEWLVFLAQTRDSDPLERSNFICGLEKLGGESETVNIILHNHWACGGIEFIVIDPNDTEKIEIAESILNDLDNYPVINEEHFYRVEEDEAIEVWKNCYTVQERINHIRKHRDEFDFNGLVEIIHCVRGECYIGYPSTIIY